MTVKEIRELSTAELKKKIRDSRSELLQMNLRKHTGQVENTGRFRELRRGIARMQTIVTEKKTAAKA